MEGLKVLLVEDDKLLSQIYQMFLQSLGHNIVGVCNNGEAAISICKKSTPDLVLMDIHIEGEINGVQTTEIIYKKFDIPVVFMTSDTKQSTLDSVLHTVFYGYIIKPIDKSVLGIQIELAYGKYTSEHELRYNKERYNSLVNDSLDTIIIINEEGIIEYINSAGLKLFKTPYIENIIGLPILSFIEDDSKEIYKKKIEVKMKKDKKVNYFEAFFRNVYDKRIEIGVVGSVVNFKNKSAVQLIMKSLNNYKDKEYYGF